MEKNVETNQVCLQGIIVFIPIDVGSKSEVLVPTLYLNRDKKIRLYKRGDNPFENSTFNDYDGKHVEVQGELIHGNKLKVLSIRIINKEYDNELSEM
ncbi:hypothetical protein IKQ19_01790 [Candidatus Saccharibacteria bacterium]|nr:hypothetical protein [Candidatus Saccharibacteria bacterium]